MIWSSGMHPSLNPSFLAGTSSPLLLTFKTAFPFVTFIYSKAYSSQATEATGSQLSPPLPLPVPVGQFHCLGLVTAGLSVKWGYDQDYSLQAPQALILLFFNGSVENDLFPWTAFLVFFFLVEWKSLLQIVLVSDRSLPHSPSFLAIHWDSPAPSRKHQYIVLASDWIWIKCWHHWVLSNCLSLPLKNQNGKIQVFWLLNQRTTCWPRLCVLGKGEVMCMGDRECVH